MDLVGINSIFIIAWHYGNDDYDFDVFTVYVRSNYLNII